MAIALKDLEAMSKDDLETLRRNVEITINSMETRRKAEAVKAMEDAARQYGFTFNDFVGADTTKPTRGKKKHPAKFRNPLNPDETWTGLGRQPRWMQDALAAGMTKSDFLIETLDTDASAQQKAESTLRNAMAKIKAEGGKEPEPADEKEPEPAVTPDTATTPEPAPKKSTKARTKAKDEATEAENAEG